MKEHPILFSAPMVKAILEGKKTMTRRVMKPQPDISQMRWNGERWEMSLGYPLGHDVPLSPYGSPGDKLWVRETWFQFIPPHLQEGAGLSSMKRVWYRADEDCPFEGCKWRPSIFMPRAASRITLEVTGVRVERLQDISHDDALREGVDDADVGAYGFPVTSYAVGNFHLLWDKINAGRGYSWESNPWVFAVEFKRV